MSLFGDEKLTQLLEAMPDAIVMADAALRPDEDAIHVTRRLARLGQGLLLC